MVDFMKKYLYRMIHIENIQHVLQYGITHRNSPNANKNFVPIGDNSLISRRNTRVVNNGKLLGNYIPFYFGTRSPMLYVIQRGYNGVNRTVPENIVYCVTSVAEIINSQIDFLFTDGHAIDSRSEEHTSELQSRPHLVCRLLLDFLIFFIYTFSLHDALPIFIRKLYSFLFWH